MKPITVILFISFLFSGVAYSWDREVGKTRGAGSYSTRGGLFSGSAYQTPMSYVGGTSQMRELKTLRRRVITNNRRKNPDIRGSEKAIDRALAFYVKNKDGISSACGGDPLAPKTIKDRNYIIVTDYSKSQDEKRQFIINLHSGEVIAGNAAHGYGSNHPISKCPPGMVVRCKTKRGSTTTKCKIPVNIGDIPETGKTSNGFFLTDDFYVSSKKSFGPATGPGNYNAIRMRGLNKTNKNAHKRAVVWHSSNYTSESGIGQCSSSAGCPATSQDVFNKMKGRIGKGALMYNHTIEEDDKGQPEC